MSLLTAIIIGFVGGNLFMIVQFLQNRKHKKRTNEASNTTRYGRLNPKQAEQRIDQIIDDEVKSFVTITKSIRNVPAPLPPIRQPFHVLHFIGLLSEGIEVDEIQVYEVNGIKIIIVTKPKGVQFSFYLRDLVRIHYKNSKRIVYNYRARFYVDNEFGLAVPENPFKKLIQLIENPTRFYDENARYHVTMKTKNPIDVIAVENLKYNEKDGLYIRVSGVCDLISIDGEVFSIKIIDIDTISTIHSAEFANEFKFIASVLDADQFFRKAYIADINGELIN